MSKSPADPQKPVDPNPSPKSYATFHHDVRTGEAAPPAPTIESEIRVSEAAAGSPPEVVARIDYSDPPEVASVETKAVPGFVPGTEIVAGGPTQQ